MNKYFMFRRTNRNADRIAGRNAEAGQHGLIMCRIGEHRDYPRAPFPMCFTRQAFCTILDTVGILPPESGAMGFSHADTVGFDLVEFSAKGSANSGGAVYRPDSEWGMSRCEFHQDQPAEAMRLWSGDLHSHPGGFGFPSGKSGPAMGDLGYVEEVFEMTEWMEWFFIPILTGTGTDEVTIHPWVCRRGRPVELMIAELVICDPRHFPKRVFNPDWEERARLAAEADAKRKAAEETAENEPNLAAETEGAPITPPSVPPVAQNTRQPERRGRIVLLNQHRTASDGPSGAIPAEAPDKNEKSARSRIPAGTYYYGGEGVDLGLFAENDQHLAAYVKRLDGIVSPTFRDKTILVVGVGAGSYAAEKLARLCPKELRFCDFDLVEMPNLTRTAYTVEDALAKRPKVQALALRCGQINPWVQVRAYSNNLTCISPFQMDEMFEGVDLVIGGTDSIEAQALVNEESVRRGIPAVFIGIHAGAQGGRVIWSIPGRTPCYRCVARDRFEAVDTGDGGTADLTAATGSIFDCQFIDMLATKIAVAILERGQDSAMGRFFQKMGSRTDVVIRCDPDYEWGKALWDAVLGDLPTSPKDFAQQLKDEVFLAMDSIWLQSAYDPGCPVCEGGKGQESLAEPAEAPEP